MYEELVLEKKGAEMDSMVGFNALLWCLRNRKANQEELSEALSVDTLIPSRWENGKQSPLLMLWK